MYFDENSVRFYVTTTFYACVGKFVIQPVIHISLQMNKWTSEEKQKLIESTQQHVKNKRINWILVSQDLQSRTPNQCRTQYNQVIQKGVKERTNHQWTFEDIQLLHVAWNQYGTKWSNIQKVYFPDRTAEQIRAKYTQMKKSHEIVNSCIQKVKNNNIRTKE